MSGVEKKEIGWGEEGLRKIYINTRESWYIKVTTSTSGFDQNSGIN
jgi:hypothetical protein